LKDRQAMTDLDKKNVASKGGMKNFPKDGNKSRWYPMYQRMAIVQWGRYIARKRHPKCVEDGVRNIAPNPNRDYTGFRGRVPVAVRHY
jgi:endonuclease III